MMRSPGMSDGTRSMANSCSPTNCYDPFLRGEGPLEAGDPRFSEAGRRQAEFQMQQTQPIDSQPKPYLPRNHRQRARFTFCVFCKNNGEEER